LVHLTTSQTFGTEFTVSHQCLSEVYGSISSLNVFVVWERIVFIEVS